MRSISAPRFSCVGERSFRLFFFVPVRSVNSSFTPYFVMARPGTESEPGTTTVRVYASARTTPTGRTALTIRTSQPRERVSAPTSEYAVSC